MAPDVLAQFWTMARHDFERTAAAEQVGPFPTQRPCTGADVDALTQAPTQSRPAGAPGCSRTATPFWYQGERA